MSTNLAICELPKSLLIELKDDARKAAQATNPHLSDTPRQSPTWFSDRLYVHRRHLARQTILETEMLFRALQDEHGKPFADLEVGFHHLEMRKQTLQELGI